MVTAAQQMQKVTDWKRQLLPRTLPAVPGWDWAAYHSENAWPGGDYHDVLPLDSDRWLVFVADATGHGGAAAVLAGLARLVLHSCPLTSGKDREPFCPVHGLKQTPPIIMARLNQVLVENSLDEQFMTAFLAAWKPEAARLDYVVAGQAMPRCWRQAHQRIEPGPDRAGIPLGISANETYAQSHVVFEPGDAVVIFTDGLIEAQNPQGEMFGVARVDTAIQEWAHQGAEAIKLGLLTSLDAFLQGQAPHDDVTFLVVKRAA